MNYTNDSDVRFYTNMGFYVGVYNYRGAGESTGVVTPDNTVSDALYVVALMKSHYHATLSVVHGISIGGYVVQGCTTHSPFVVYDRTFATWTPSWHISCVGVSLLFHAQLRSLRSSSVCVAGGLCPLLRAWTLRSRRC